MSRSPTLHRILWASTSSWLQQGLGVFTTFFVARMLDPAAFGLVAIAMLFILIIQRLLIESVGQTIVRMKQVDERTSDAAFWLAVGTGACLGLALLALAAPLSTLFGLPEATRVIQVLAIIPLLDGLGCVQTALLRREGRYKLLATRTAAANLAAMLVAITMASLGLGVWSLVFQQVVLSTVSAATLWTVSSWRPGSLGTLAATRAIAIFGAPLAVNSIVNVAVNRTDQAFLASVAGPAAVGIYSLAKRAVRLLLDSVITGPAAVALSSLAIESEKERARSSTRLYFRYVAFVSWPIFLGMALTAKEFVLLVLGVRWVDATLVLPILALSAIPQSLVLISSNIIIAKGRASGVLAVNALAFGVLVAGLLFFSSGTPSGAAWALAAQSTVGATCMVGLSLWATGLRASALMAALSPAIIGCAAMAVAVVWGDASLPLGTPLPLALSLKVAVGTIAYAVASASLMRAELRRAIAYFRPSKTMSLTENR